LLHCFPTTFRQFIGRKFYISRNIVCFMFRGRTFFANDIFTYLNNVANETNNLPIDLTINGIAASWINRDRVPLVTVIRDYETGKINLTQVSWTKALFPARTRDAGRHRCDFHTDKATKMITCVLFIRGWSIPLVNGSYISVAGINIQ